MRSLSANLRLEGLLIGCGLSWRFPRGGAQLRLYFGNAMTTDVLESFNT